MPRFLHEFLVLGDGKRIDNGWWEIQGTHLVNAVGGMHSYTPHKDDIIIEAESWDEVDCSGMLVPESPYGWVAPDGRFYGCDWAEHATIARLVLKSSEQELEKTHVKVYRPLMGQTEAYTRRTFLTEEQVDTLKKRGLTFCYIDNGVVDFEKDEVVTKRYGEKKNIEERV